MDWLTACMDVDDLLSWIAAYERAWRSPGTERLARIFTEDAVYLHSPYARPVEGLEAIARMWEDDRDGPDEVFTMEREAVSVSEDTGVARVEVRYGEPVWQEFRCLWVVRFAPDGRATRFEEWPYWPEQGWAPEKAEPLVVDGTTVPATPYEEVVRSGSLSAGVYVLPAGGRDMQLPHTEDEVYVVLAGEAVLEVAGERTAVSRGSVAYVPARAVHRFTGITSELRVAVVFAPPENAGVAR